MVMTDGNDGDIFFLLDDKQDAYTVRDRYAKYYELLSSIDAALPNVQRFF